MPALIIGGEEMLPFTESRFAELFSAMQIGWRGE